MRRSLVFAALFLFPTAVLAQETAVPIALDDPGFEESEPGASVTGWGGNMLPPDQNKAGYRATIDTSNPATGAASLRIKSQGEISAGRFGTITRALDVQALRGRKIRLTGKARVSAVAPQHAGFWLRVDRPGGQRGFFDNMGDRRITSGEWTSYVIEGDVAHDATNVIFGFLVQGYGTAWVDDFAIEDVGPVDAPKFEDKSAQPGPTRTISVAGDAAPAAIADSRVANLKALARVYGLVRWFHPSDQAAEVDWGRVLIGAIPQVEAAENAEQLSAVLQKIFAPIAPTVQFEAGESVTDDNAPASGKHVQWSYSGFPSSASQLYRSERVVVDRPADVQPINELLPGGVTIRLPLTAPVNEAGRTLPLGNTPTQDSGKPKGWVPAGFDRTTRIAGMISAWAMFDHFYPYWDVVETDWDGLLAPMMQEAALAPDDIAYRDVLLRLVEGLEDGHGGVNYRYEGRKILPLDWAWIEDQLVITAAPAGALNLPDFVPGAVVKTIDGAPVEEAIAARKALVSGSDQWKTHIALSRLRQSHETGERVLLIENAIGQQSEMTLPLIPNSRDAWVREPRPDVVSELEPGIVYVDIDRLTDAKFAAGKAQIEAAEGLVFDLRGYPKGRYPYLSHMTDDPIRSAEMNTPIQTLPDAQFDSWRDGGWRITPALPRYTDNIVFITAGSAISWSESILGTVKANGLGTIVGTPTAGANGNVTTFNLPGGYQLRWTGMQVINRDGSQHHINGVQPDILVKRSLESVRQGRDELLAAAIAEVKRQMEGD